MPIPLNLLCATELIEVIKLDEKNDIDILPGGNARYHNYREAYVLDSADNLLSFQVNVRTANDPRLVEARFQRKSGFSGISYCLAPVDPAIKRHSAWRLMKCVETFDPED